MPVYDAKIGILAVLSCGATGMSVNCPRFKLPSPNRRTERPIWRAAIVVSVLDPLKSALGARERAFGVPIGGVDVRQFSGKPI